MSFSVRVLKETVDVRTVKPILCPPVFLMMLYISSCLQPLDYLLVTVHLLQLNASEQRAETLICPLCVRHLKQLPTHKALTIQSTERSIHSATLFLSVCACPVAHM